MRNLFPFFSTGPVKTLRPTTKSPTTPPVVGKKPSFLAEVANVTQQQVLPNLMNRILPQNDQLPGTPKKEAGKTRPFILFKLCSL